VVGWFRVGCFRVKVCLSFVLKKCLTPFPLKVEIQRQGCSFKTKSVGESKCWIFGKGFDHELSLMQYRKPLLVSGEAQAIGFCMEMIGSIVIGSDGLFDYTSIEKIKYEIQDKNTTAKNLAMLAKEATGGLQDDVSVVLLKEKHGHTSS